jgi:hypothetical protein
MMEDEPRGNLDPVRKKVTLQIKGTTAPLKRHFVVNMSKVETRLHVTESTAKAGRL